MPITNCPLPPTTRWPLLAAVVAAACIACHLPVSEGARHEPPRSVAEVVDRLRERGLDYQVVAACHAGPIDNGAFLCAGEKPWVEVNRLSRSRARSAHWSGVVHIQPFFTPEMAEDTMQDWDECGARVGNLVFFGDPQLLREVVSALKTDHAG
jgi:hypothetical protein